ncbi:protein crumbs homolog 3-like [Erpetoichthys calabaricus]|uniref:protein crumbs homolog 3-like n=1 Tax=Erpetoichthys calabaricus TaxID=27687 RepID=UPI00109F8C55|nr:protein crumbs homolog 3-like [Erpetoichthys calabaricus]
MMTECGWAPVTFWELPIFTWQNPKTPQRTERMLLWMLLCGTALLGLGEAQSTTSTPSTATTTNQTSSSTVAPVNIAAIVAPSVIGGCLLILVIFLIVFFKVRDKRRLEGTYRPREEETEGTQKQPPSNLKLPPEERLI